MKKLLYKIFIPLFRLIGFVRINKGNVNINSKQGLLDNFYYNIKKTGFNAKHIVDVGANHGTWTREALEHFPDACFTMIEPQNWLEEDFKDLTSNETKFKYYPIGAGSLNGSFFFTVAIEDYSSSFTISKAEAEAKGLKQIEIPIRTLNDVLSESIFSKPDIIKIDAEGLDLEVLKGASNYIGITELILVEAGVVSKENENTIAEMISYMDKQGYRLFEITDLNRPFEIKILWLVELAFIKKGGIIDSYKFIY